MIPGARVVEVAVAMTAQYWEKHPEPAEEEAEDDAPPPEPEIIE